MQVASSLPSGFQDSGYHPHGVCYLWEPDLLWTHVVADGLIALAYYSIPVALIYFVRKRRDVPFDALFVAFAIFILACGTTHAMAIWTLWNPDYWASAGVKIVTALASVATAGLLVPLLPKALAVPTPTELRRKNRELEAAHDEIASLNVALEGKIAALRSANADLQAFAYSVSHDLRAPLRSMEGFSVALLEDCAPNLDDECRNYAGRIREGAHRMSALIEDLLAYSRVALTDHEPEGVGVDHVVQEVIESFQERITGSGAEVLIESDGARVLGRRSILMMILSNLLDNAITYVPEGRVPEVRITSRRVGDHVRVEVADNGIGIAAEHQKRIFGLFERLHGGDQYPGTGIGLATVARGAAKLNGSFGVDSKPDEGSTFWVALPLADSGEVS